MQSVQDLVNDYSTIQNEDKELSSSFIKKYRIEAKRQKKLISQSKIEGEKKRNRMTKYGKWLAYNGVNLVHKGKFGESSYTSRV